MGLATSCRLSALAFGLAVARPVHADPASVKGACTAHHEQGQRLRNSGKLHAASAEFAECVRDECPALVKTDCADLLARVDTEAPTVVLVVRDEKGSDRADVRLFVDGEAVRDRLDGMPVAMDPGEHVLRFEAVGAGAVERQVVLRVGEKRRRVAVVLHAAAPPEGAPWPAPPEAAPAPSPALAAPPAEATHVSPYAYVLGGLSLAAVGAFTYFAISGKSLENSLAGSCSPGCTDAQVAPVRRDYLAADLSLGVAAVSMGAALWLFFHPSTTSAVQSARLTVDAASGRTVLGIAGWWR
jgi:hypothetical protein